MSVQSAMSRKTLHDELVAWLRHMIVAGDLRPGSRIAEKRLCARFGVSRTPLREALKVLSAEGLVRLLPNKGASVARVTRQEVAEISPLLGVLEALAGELACAQIDDAGLARMRAMHQQQLEHYRRGDALAYHEVGQAIHEAIFETAGNRTLIETYDRLHSRLKSLLFVIREAPPQWAEAVDDHEGMMKALQAQDSETFARIVRRQVRHRADAMGRALDVLDSRADGALN